MATIKSYTDIEQSKKLAEFLPLESADMHTIVEDVVDEDTGDIVSIELTKLGAPISFDFPCWSLAALLDVLPDNYIDADDTIQHPSLIKTKDSRYMVIYSALLYTSLYDNPLDACVAMVEKLHKLNLL